MEATPSDKRQLAVPNHDAARRDLSAKPSSMLDDAIRNLDPATIEWLAGIAAKEAITLEVKKREAEIHDQSTQNQLDQAIDAVRRVTSTGQQLVFEGEEKSSSGSTRIKVWTTEEPKREVKGSCFVATACFGDSDHPAVIQLRQYRDAVLSKHDCGRRFITWYYANGPWMASLVDRLPFLKPPLRLTFRVFCWCCYTRSENRLKQSMAAVGRFTVRLNTSANK